MIATGGSFSVNLYDHAADLMAMRGDFTLEELLNFACAKEYKNQSNLRRNG